MLLEKQYKRNKVTGEIVKREIVEIVCDQCGKKWETAYSNRKRKRLDVDLCGSCRSSFALKNSSSSLADRRWNFVGKRKVEFTCKSCGAKGERFSSLLCEKNNFCNFACRDSYQFRLRYGHLERKFRENINEVAYLIGLILGDGHIKKSGKNTHRISIAFDAGEKWTEIKKEAKDTLDKLGIKWHEEPKIHKSCSMIGFIIPDGLLKEYNILFEGNKFFANPCPCEEIVHNINFAVGLINTDGCFSKRNRTIGYSFCNVVKSITQSLSDCLKYNGIDHRMYKRKGHYDDRTKNNGREQHNIYFLGKEKTRKFHKLSSFKTKGTIVLREILKRKNEE